MQCMCGAEIEHDAVEQGHELCFDCWLWSVIMKEES